MTLFFKSKSSLDSKYKTEYKQEEDEDEEEHFQEYEEQYYDDFEAYDPLSTPFISPGFDDTKRDNNNNNNSNNDDNNGSNGQFTILAFVATALRKSLLLTCDYEDDEDDEDINSNVSSMEISCPTNVRHVSHVTFDKFKGFLGLPDEFQGDVFKRVPSASVSVFGVSPHSMQCSIDERGNSVPTILLKMQKRLYAEGGLQAEGIFRINPENSQEESVRSQLNRGFVPHGIDVHCLAGLIKAWLRELPKGVLDCLAPQQVMGCNTEDDCTQLVTLLPPMEAALLNWTVNLMADVAQNEQYNKMNARNIAMVFAPNMTQMADPLTALIHAVQVMNFLKTLIVKTLQVREQASEKARFQSSSSDSSSTTSSNTQKSISFGELLSRTHHEISTPTGDVVHSKKLLRSVTLDRLDCNPEKKHRKYQKKNDDEGKSYFSNSHNSSPVISMTTESGDDREVEAGILERLNFRKGVKKLCRHPVFQLSKSTKKSAELGMVNSR